MNDPLKLPDFGKLLLVTAIACCVSILISKKADAGQFSKIVAIVVATDDGQVTTIPVKPVDIGPTELMAVKPQIASNPFRKVNTTTKTTRTVCGPDGVCREVEVAASASCPCDCVDCTCNTPAAAPAASTTTTTTTTRVTSHAASNHYAGPVRRVLGRVAKFVVKGGPIRQALRANRQSRRGG